MLVRVSSARIIARPNDCPLVAHLHVVRGMVNQTTHTVALLEPAREWYVLKITGVSNKIHPPLAMPQVHTNTPVRVCKVSITARPNDCPLVAHLHVVRGVGNQNTHTVALLEPAREWYVLKITGISNKIHPPLARPPIHTNMLVRICSARITVRPNDCPLVAHLHVVRGMVNQTTHTVALLEPAREWYVLKITGISKKIHPPLARPPIHTNMLVRVSSARIIARPNDCPLVAHLHVVRGMVNQTTHTVALLEPAREWYVLKITGVSKKIHPPLARPPIHTNMLVRICSARIIARPNDCPLVAHLHVVRGMVNQTTHTVALLEPAREWYVLKIQGATNKIHPPLAMP
jgi:type IV pilus biogenesis protein CpaD/CtpE